MPSFSSRGFGIDNDGISEIARALEFAAPLITDAFLVSAYDLYYGLLPGRKQLEAHPIEGPLGNPALLFIDSGGYETREAYDLSEVYRFPSKPQPWTPEQLKEVFDGASVENPIVLVSFDRASAFDEQIQAARSFFAPYGSIATDLLLKPHSPDADYLDIERLLPHVKELSHFTFVGVTEKELGNRILERMERIAQLRVAMDRAGVDRPIHVFGSLDPLITPLYFLAGAEVFDGLSWLRYAYREGLSIYGDALSVLNSELQDTGAERRSKMLNNNLASLRRLALTLRVSILGGSPDFAKLGPNEDVYRFAFDALRTRVEGR